MATGAARPLRWLATEVGRAPASRSEQSAPEERHGRQSPLRFAPAPDDGLSDGLGLLSLLIAGLIAIDPWCMKLREYARRLCHCCLKSGFSAEDGFSFCARFGSDYDQDSEAKH